MAEKEKTLGSKSQPVINPNPPKVKAYTKEDVDKAITDAVREATGKQGQVHKLEKDKLMTQVADLRKANADLTGTTEDNKTTISALEASIEELSKEDPEKKNLVRLTNKLIADQKNAQAERRQNVVEKKTIEDTKADLAKTRRSNLITATAAKYKNAEGKPVSPEDLAVLCDTFEIGDDEEKIALAAGTKWNLAETTDNPQAPAPAPKVPYDKSTSGGGGSELTEDERLAARYPTMYRS